MNLYQTILVAIDLTYQNDLIISKAKKLAEKFNSNIYLLYAVEPLPITAYPFVNTNELEKMMLEEAIGRMRWRGQQYDIPVSHQIVVINIPKIAIIETAEAINADLLILGSHSKRGMPCILGSTASSVVNCATQDVIVIYTDS